MKSYGFLLGFVLLQSRSQQNVCEDLCKTKVAWIIFNVAQERENPKRMPLLCKWLPCKPCQMGRQRVSLPSLVKSKDLPSFNGSSKDIAGAPSVRALGPGSNVRWPHIEGMLKWAQRWRGYTGMPVVSLHRSMSHNFTGLNQAYTLTLTAIIFILLIHHDKLRARRFALILGLAAQTWLLRTSFIISERSKSIRTRLPANLDHTTHSWTNPLILSPVPC